MRELFRNRNFVKMLLATFASQFGTIVGNMAFAFYLLDRYSSRPGYASLAELMYSLPTLLVFWIVGVIADRFDRQRIAEYSGWLRVAVTCALLFALHEDWLPLAFALLFLRSAIAKFYAPAESALLQGILKPEHYTQASGMNQTLLGVFMLFGVGLGAAAYHAFGIIWAMAIDGFGLTASALLIRSCRIPAEAKLPNGPGSWRGLRLREVRGDFAEGLRYIRSKPLLLALVGGFLLFGLLNGGFAVLPLYTMKYKLAPDNYTFFSSMFAVFFGIGILLGSVAGTYIVQKLKPHAIVIFGLMATGALSLGFFSVTNPWAYLVLVLLVGMAMAPVNIAIGGWLPRLADPRQMGRVAAWSDPLLMLGQSVALGLISWLYPGTIGLNFIYASLAVILFASCGFYAATLPRLQNQARIEGVGQQETGIGM